jgi:hypothetical protein
MSDLFEEYNLFRPGAVSHLSLPLQTFLSGALCLVGVSTLCTCKINDHEYEETPNNKGFIEPRPSPLGLEGRGPDPTGWTGPGVSTPDGQGGA